ncbi:MAG: DNA-3-methyladenine glycosylase [bacterium]|nr:DNA-3-methyladenine glycosylase [bacterium]
MKGRILQREFFERSVLKVAPDLLGKVLVRRYRGKEIAGMITEVEAYDGPRDKASHASRGITERNKIMFGPAGHFYVYFTYGMHWMLNVVTGKKNYPAAVLIRGVQCLGVRLPNIENEPPSIVEGPGKLTKFLHIDKTLNGKLACRASGLWIEDRGIVVPRGKIERTPRIGVQYAGNWALRPYRFLIRRNRLR